ncbi:MAG TPA: AMP-binding protein, partial [Acidobacteriota bacterium]|nr:AMP-binding protein [Acidobacteriota bacterium]
MNIPLTPLRFLERARHLFRDKVAVIGRDRRWTYKEYAERSYCLANFLKESGLTPGGRVAFLAYNSHELLEAYYGVLLAGGILLPLNIRLRSSDFRYILNDAGAEYLFVDRDFWDEIDTIRQDLQSVKTFVLLGSKPRTGRGGIDYEEIVAKHSSSFDLDILEVDENSVAELFYTSGTTGHPKGVMLTHRNLYLHALEVAIATGARESDIHLHTIPLFHVNGWGTPQFLTGVGGTHVLLHRFDPAEVLRLIEEAQVTTFSMVPTMAIALVNHPDAQQTDCSSLRL